MRSFLGAVAFVVSIAVASIVIVSNPRAQDVAPKEKLPLRVAFVANNSFDFWRAAKVGAERAAKDFGVVVEFKMPGQGTFGEQRDLIDGLLKDGVNAIAVSPNQVSKDYFAGLGAKTPLVMVDNDLPNPAGRRAFIGFHNYRMGRAAGGLLVKAVPVGGKVFVAVGTLDVRNSIERRQGLLDVLAGVDRKEIGKPAAVNAKNLKAGKYLVDSLLDGVSSTKCQELCEDALEKHPETAAFVGLWAYNSPALQRAAEKAKSKAAIVGFDDDDETLAAIKAGTIAGTVIQPAYELGYETVRLLAALAQGNDKLHEIPAIDSGKRVFVPHRVVTGENVDAYRAETKQRLGS